MKLERQQYGVKIFLTDEECDEMRSMMHLCAEWEYDLSRLILVELDEYSGESND